MTWRRLLIPLVPVYRLAQRLDRARKERERYRSPLRVISVGNISVGGTGKTPLVRLIVEELCREMSVMVLSRGYGRTATDDRVWRAGFPLPNPDHVGDEPAMLARSITRGALGVGANRVALLRRLEKDYPGGVVILDDGFQQYRVARDLDIVIVDDHTATTGLLPAGDLREPPQALARADVIIATSEAAAAFAARFAAPGTPIHRSRTVPLGVSAWEGGAAPAGRRFALVTGIARPGRVAASAAQLGIAVHTVLAYGDHHRYTARDAEHIARACAGAGANAILTTEKDAVKLAAFGELSPMLYTITITTEVEGWADVMAMVKAAVA